MLPERAQDVEAVDAWQHGVKHDQFVVTLQRQVPAIDAVQGDIDNMAPLGQTALQVFGQLGLILDDQDAHGRFSGGKRQLQ